MRLLVLSDLHVEYSSYEPDPAAVHGCDVVVLAGDIHQGAAGLRWARQKFASVPVVMVAGNHEYYDGHWNQTLEEMRVAARDLEIYFLENDEVSLGGIRFLGCTLWVDFDYFGADARQVAMTNYERGLVDCRRIRAPRSVTTGETSGAGPLTAEHVRSRHLESVKWLEGALARIFHERRTV